MDEEEGWGKMDYLLKSREYTGVRAGPGNKASNPPRQKAIDKVRGRVGLRFIEIPRLGERKQSTLSGSP